MGSHRRHTTTGCGNQNCNFEKKSEVTRVFFPEDVYYFLASSDSRNIRELEGMLIRLGAFSSLQNIPVTLDMAKENLKAILGDRHKEITVELIQKSVAEYFDMKIVDIKSDKRLKNIVQARQIAIWFCREITKSSYPDIKQKNIHMVQMKLFDTTKPVTGLYPLSTGPTIYY